LAGFPRLSDVSDRSAPKTSSATSMAGMIGQSRQLRSFNG